MLLLALAGAVADAPQAPAARTRSWFNRLAIVGVVLPIIANWSGWIFTEMGRQPWVVYGLLKTSDARSPNVSMASIIISLTAYILVYGVLVDRRRAAVRARDSARPRGAADAARGDPPAPTAAVTCRRPRDGVLICDDPSFLQALWFVPDRRPLDRLLRPRGLRLRRRHPAARRSAATSAEKRAIIHTIGPVWDGNEVWLLTAGGATFAAFPGWYASLFSGFYLALLLILLALIVRGVSFEFWGKDDSPRWRATWEWTTVIGSGAAALLWGVGWADIVHGVPMDAAQHRHRDALGSAASLRAARRPRRR